MSREEKKRAVKKAQHLDGRRSKLMMQAAKQLEISQRNIELLQSRNDYWRNLLVASAFARGLGNERPISEVVAEAHPELMRLQP